MKVIISLCILLAGIEHLVVAQDGSLDASFGDSGILLYQDAGYTTPANAVVIKPDGSILTIGERYDGFGSQLLMLGYLPDGLIDESWGSNNLAGFPTWGYPGIVHTDIPGSNREYAYAAKQQPDGKIVVGGYANTGGDWLLARYMPNGTLDSSFAENGFLTRDLGGFETINSIILLSDGKILAAGTGNYNLRLARFLGDGSLDTEFGNNGFTGNNTNTGSEGRIAMDDSGNIYLSGTEGEGSNGSVVLVKFKPDGTADTNFGNNGKISIPSGQLPSRAYIAISPGNKLVIASDYPSNFGTNSDLLLCRFDSDGNPDQSFNGSGQRVLSFGDYVSPGGMLVQSDGAIIVTGRINISGAVDLFVAKFRSDGSDETDFGSEGLAVSGLGLDGFSNSALGLSLAMTKDDQIIAGGMAWISGLNNLLLVKFNNSVGKLSSATRHLKAAPLICYPNPVSEYLYFETGEEVWENYRIYDQMGREIASFNPEKGTNKVFVGNIPPAVYYFIAENNTFRRTGRFVKD